MGGASVQDLPDTRRRQVVGISRPLWQSLKEASRGRVRIRRAATTVTEPIGAALVRLALRKFAK